MKKGKKIYVMGLLVLLTRQCKKADGRFDRTERRNSEGCCYK